MPNYATIILEKSDPQLTARMVTVYSSSTRTSSPKTLLKSYLRLGNMVIFTTPTLSQEVLQVTLHRILTALLTCLRFINTEHSDPSPSSLNAHLLELSSKVYKTYPLSSTDKILHSEYFRNLLKSSLMYRFGAHFSIDTTQEFSVLVSSLLLSELHFTDLLKRTISKIPESLPTSCISDMSEVEK